MAFCQCHLLNEVALSAVRGPPKISSAKRAKLFAFKNIARLMKGNLLTGPTSQPKHRAVSSNPSFSCTPVGFEGPLPMRVHTFFKIIILCLSSTRGKTAPGPRGEGVVDTDAGCALASWNSRLSPARGLLGTWVCDRAVPRRFLKTVLGVRPHGLGRVPSCSPVSSQCL